MSYNITYMWISNNATNEFIYKTDSQIQKPNSSKKNQTHSYEKVERGIYLELGINRFIN